MALILIGLTAGLFSALFGVGGGIVAVPLMLFARRFTERPAMATSLAAIGITAVAGTISYAVDGEVRVVEAALLGVPAAVGAVFGATWQQRVRQSQLSYLFAALLVAIAVYLLASRGHASNADTLHLGAGEIAGAIAIGLVR